MMARKTNSVWFTSTQGFRNVIKRALPVECRLIAKGHNDTGFAWEVQYPASVSEEGVVHALKDVRCVATISGYSFL